MKVLFTTSNKIGSRVIRKVTGEPVSHCALQFECGDYRLVIHAGLHGVEIIPLAWFLQTNQLLYEISIKEDEPRLIDLDVYVKKSYDFMAILWLGFCFLINCRPSRNNWAVKKAHMCTELVTEILYGEADSVITPYGLYLKLKEQHK